MKMKPCPFCGGKPKYLTIEGEDNPNDGGECIECRKCGASSVVMFPLMDSVKELLVERWNNRVEGR